MPKQPRHNASKYAGIGVQLVALCVVLVLAGNWLDDYFNQDSTFLLSGIFIAVFAVMYLIIKKLK